MGWTGDSIALNDELLTKSNGRRAEEMVEVGTAIMVRAEMVALPFLPVLSLSSDISTFSFILSS